jgi:hypothetical protein
MSLVHYSPKDVSVTIAGFYQVEGYVDGTFVNIIKDIKPFSVMKSMDGEVARIYRKDESFKVELTLAQSSGANDFLSSLYNIDVATQIGKFPLFIKDGRGTTNFLALTSWIEDIPNVSFSNGIESRTWVLGCTQATLHVGGNVPQSMMEQALSLGTSMLPLLKNFGII